MSVPASPFQGGMEMLLSTELVPMIELWSDRCDDHELADAIWTDMENLIMERVLCDQMTARGLLRAYIDTYRSNL